MAAPLTDRYHLSVAGIEFAVRGAGCLLEPNPEESYGAFESLDPAGGAAETIPVLVRAGEVFPIERMERVFATADIWTLLRDPADGTRHLQLHPGGEDPQGWVARLEPQRVEIRCGAPYSRRQGGRTVVWDPLHYPADQLLLAHYLGGRGLLAHAGAAVRGGRSLLFAGVSGAGKTTLAGILAAGGFGILSDDRVVLRMPRGGPVAWGTPWPGEGEHARNESAPLAGLLLLEQAPGCELLPLAPRAALARLLPALSLPWHDVPALGAPLDLLDRILAAVPAHLLRFAPGPGAARLLRRLLGEPPRG